MYLFLNYRVHVTSPFIFPFAGEGNQSSHAALKGRTSIVQTNCATNQTQGLLAARQLLTPWEHVHIITSTSQQRYRVCVCVLQLQIMWNTPECSVWVTYLWAMGLFRHFSSMTGLWAAWRERAAAPADRRPAVGTSAAGEQKRGYDLRDFGANSDTKHLVAAAKAEQRVWPWC